MQAPVPPPDEPARLAALADLAVLDSGPEAVFDRLTEAAAALLNVPIVLISLVDAQRQWFKSRYGLEVQETPRDISFCGHVVEASAELVVPDAALDPRFVDNPLVTGGPRIRFYAGMPLRSAAGHVLGSLCAIDRTPRHLGAGEQAVLRLLAEQAVQLLETRRTNRLLDEARAEVARGHEQLARLLDAIPALVGYWSKDRRNVFANSKYAEWFGQTQAELRGKHLREVLSPDLYQLNLPHLELAFAGEDQTFRRSHQTLLGMRHVQASYVADRRQGQVEGIFVLSTDVTELEEARAEAVRAHEQLSKLIDSIPALVAYWDRHRRIVFANQRYAEWFGVDPASLLGGHASEVLGPEMYALNAPHLDRALAGEEQHFQRSQQMLHGRRVVSAAYVPDLHQGQVLGVFALGTDVTELEDARAALAELARTDPLTQLYNRRAVEELVERERARAQRTGEQFQVALIDIDHFKHINDRHGHAIGDAVLRRVAQVMKVALREADLCARWGGEEFLVLLPRTEAAGGQLVIERLRAQAALPAPELPPITLSAGLTAWSPRGESFEQALAQADARLYAAKAAGRNRTIAEDSPLAVLPKPPHGS